MQQLGSTYEQVIADPHHSMQVRIDVLSDPSTVVLADVPFSAGQMQLDRTAAVRRQVSATLVDDDTLTRAGSPLTPAHPGDPISPYGSLIRPTYYVWSYVHSTPIGVQLGLLRLSNVHPVGDGTISIVAYDFARMVQKNRFTAPYIVPAGTNYTTAICSLLQDRLGGLYVLGSVMATDETTPQLTFDADSDPWAAAQSMAATLGAEVFFDEAGQVTIQRLQDPGDATLVWDYDETLGMLLDADKTMDDEDGPNGVVMQSESSVLAAPIKTILWDANPSSPTYYLGPYGQRAVLQSSPYIGTQSQCDAAATKWLTENLGGTEQVTASILPNPAHEGGDVLHVAYARARIDDLYVLDGYTVPFSAKDSQPITTRQRRSISGVLIDQGM
jgi:hypothetical protein